MAWRTVHISEAARLSLKDGQMVVARDTGEVRLALEDVAVAVLDTPQVSLSGALLAACMDASIGVIQCDSKHIPAGMALPFHTHFRQAGIAHAQVETSLPFRKRCWKKLVQAKIANQASVLKAVGAKQGSRIGMMSGRVRSGDPDNVEAQAARLYWSWLFKSFKRGADDRTNALLNYGYAVVRGAVARGLVGAGLLPAFGLHHASVTNAFNLADDLIEPFRPFVDLLVWQRLNDEPQQMELSLEDRRFMLGVMNAPCAFGGETTSLLAACERTAQSLVRAIESSSPNALDLPALPAAANAQS